MRSSLVRNICREQVSAIESGGVTASELRLSQDPLTKRVP